MKSKRVYKYEFKDGGDLPATGVRHISIAKANNNVSCIVIAANAFGFLSQIDTGGTAGSYARYRDWETDRKSTRLNSSHEIPSRMPSSA